MKEHFRKQKMEKEMINQLPAAESPRDHKMQVPSTRKGGMRTMPFIIANETFEKVASYGLLANMMLYLMGDYNMGTAKAGSVLYIWGAVSNFVPILGAFISDSYFGRFRVIALGSIISLLGMTLLWLTAMVQSARPAECSYPYTNCASPTSLQLTALFAAFALMSTGAGGIRPCSLAFGADQMQHPDPKKSARILQSFFNWYYASVGISLMVAVTVIVYVQDHEGWKVGFAVPAILMAISTLLFFMGSPLYVKVKADKSMFTGLAQVLVAAVGKRNVAFPTVGDKAGDTHFHTKGSRLDIPTENLRFLNKACIIVNRSKELNPDGTATNPRKLSSVQQVEDLKSLIKVLPIWSTGIFIAITISQSFQIVQANTMDRHLGPNFQIPAGSYSVFGLLSLTIWVAIYDRIVVPFLRRTTGEPRGLSHKQRMGAGLLLATASSAVAAVVESHRRRTAIREGFADNGRAVTDMSAMWLVPQHCLAGLAEAFNAIGQIEFYYDELPRAMSSVGVALLFMGMGVGNLMGSAVIELVDHVTKTKGRVSWLDDNLNRGRYDNYYWLLAVLGLVNFLYFAGCGWAYGPCKEHIEGNKGFDDGVEEGDDDNVKSRELAVVV